MPSAEFALWQAFHRDVGFGETRADWRDAIGFSAVCRGLGTRVRADELIPRFGRKPPTPTALVRAWLEGLTPDRFWK